MNTASIPIVSARRVVVFRALIASFCVLTSLVTSGTVVAQVVYGRPAAANEVTKFQGILKASQGNLITVTREDGVDCLVQFPEQITSLNFVAKALPAYLRPGMPIRFTTTLGPGGQPLTPVDRIEIFAPIAANMVSHASKDKYTPGIHHVDRHHKQPRNAPIVGKVYVVGSLMMISPQGVLAMQAGSTPVQTPVDPDVKLELRLNNLSLAQPGDSVSVSGFYEPPDDTKVRAESITIATDRVYGEAPPPKERRSRKSRRGAAADDAAEAVKAEAGKAGDAAKVDPAEGGPAKEGAEGAAKPEAQ